MTRAEWQRRYSEATSDIEREMLFRTALEILDTDLAAHRAVLADLIESNDGAVTVTVHHADENGGHDTQERVATLEHVAKTYLASEAGKKLMNEEIERRRLENRAQYEARILTQAHEDQLAHGQRLSGNYYRPIIAPDE